MLKAVLSDCRCVRWRYRAREGSVHRAARGPMLTDVSPVGTRRPYVRQLTSDQKKSLPRLSQSLALFAGLWQSSRRAAPDLQCMRRRPALSPKRRSCPQWGHGLAANWLEALGGIASEAARSGRCTRTSSSQLRCPTYRRQAAYFVTDAKSARARQDEPTR